MPRYDFRCPYCGPFERIVGIREVTDATTCPDCDGPATRVFGSPMVFTRSSPVRRAVAAAERSADAPAVTTRTTSSTEPPPLRGRRAKLPRP